MRFFNNTSYKTIPAQELLNSVAHLLLPIRNLEIESISLEDNRLTVYGIECIHLEHDLSKPLKVEGVVRWYDKLGGTGMIRLASGQSVHFFACNVVGADSPYEFLVTNVNFEKGEKIVGEISSCEFLFAGCGLTNIRKVA